MAEPNMSTETGPAVGQAAPAVIPRARPNKDARAPVAVWDPDQGKLKAVPFDQAPQFIEMGYKVGGDAQVEALNKSGLAKAAAIASGTADATSAGTFDAILAQSHYGRGLIASEQIANEANPGYHLGGEVLGLGATAYAGGLGGVAGESLKDLAAIGGLKSIAAEGIGGKVAGKALEYGARGARVALEAAPYTAIKGAMDTVTEDSLLGHPVTVQHMAAGALHSVVEGAGINLFAHGILKSAGGLRTAVGNSMAYAEKWGAIKREMIEVEQGLGAEGKPLASEKEYTRKYKVGTDPDAEPIITPPAGTSGPVADEAVGRLGEAIDVHPSPNMAAIESEAGPSMDAMAPAPIPVEGAAQDGTIIPGHYADFEPPVPMPRKPMREPSAVGGAREQLEKYQMLADMREQGLADVTERAESLGKTEIPRAGESAAKQVEEEIPLDERPMSWQWQKGISPRGKRMKIVELTKIRLGEVGEEALEMYEKVRKLEAEIKSLKQGPQDETLTRVTQAKADEKQMLGERLKIMVPRERDPILKVDKPGFADYDQEYARTYGKDRNLGDIAAPAWGPSQAAEQVETASRKTVQREMKAARDELAEHMAALDKVGTSETALKKAEINVYIAEKKLSRLTEAFEQNKTDTTEFLDAKDERANFIAKRKYDNKLKFMREEGAIKAEIKKADQAQKDARQAVKDAKDAAKAAETKATRARERAEAAQRRSDKEIENARKAQNKQNMKEAPQKGEKEKTKRTWESPEGIHTETKVSQIKNGFVHERYHIKIDPHAPPKQYKKGGYKIPWDGSNLGTAGKAGFYTGMPGVGLKVAGAMLGHNALIHVLNQHEAIGKAWTKYVGALAKGSSVTYKYYKRAKAHESHGAMNSDALGLKHYDDIEKAVTYLHANPQVVSTYLTKTNPNLAAVKPEVISSVSLGIMRALEQIEQVIPKRPFSPTLQGARFQPTRAQQVQVLRMWQALGAPGLAVGYGDHAVFAALDKAYPDLQQANREVLVHQVQTSKKPLRGRQARQYSQAIGAPVRPNDDAGALKRLQQTAGPAPMKKPAGGQSSGGSSKIKNQAATRDLPAGSQSQLGG